MRVEGEWYVLDSGRRFQAAEGILGIDAEGSDPRLFSGYDDKVSVEVPESVPDGDYDFTMHELTQEERADVAAYMIERWKAWVRIVEERQHE